MIKTACQLAWRARIIVQNPERNERRETVQTFRLVFTFSGGKQRRRRRRQSDGIWT